MQAYRYTALPGSVVLAPGRAAGALDEEVRRLGGTRVLVLASEREAARGQDLLDALGDRVVAVFTAVRPHVPVAVAEAARALARDVRADLLVAVGGGSAVGTAKAVALTGDLPIVAVPTTFAGSEVTPVWGLTDANGKTTGTDPRVLPRGVVYDPALTLTLPTEVAGASVLNAMAHAVEAFWAPARNPVSSLVAAEAVRVLAAGLEAMLADASSQDARGDLLHGCYLAASAFAVAGSGLHHKVCHVLGGSFDAPHAQTHAVVLPHVLAYNAPAAPVAAQRIAAALHTPAPAEALQDLGRRAGVPKGLADLGLTREQVLAAAGIALPRVPADNPRPVTRDDLTHLLLDAWEGAAPGTSTKEAA